MPDFLTEFFKWIEHPDMLSLGTIAGLAGFLKLIVIPFIKWAADRLKKPISGTATVVAAFTSSLLIAEAVGWITSGAMTMPVVVQMLSVSIMATLSALGMQSTTTAVIRSEKA